MNIITKQLRKAIVFCVIGVSLILNIPAVFAAETATVAVFATADMHGNIMGWDYLQAKAADVGLAKVSTLVKQERQKYPNNLLIDNGDFLQGTPLDAYYATVDKTWSIHPMVDVYNTMQYDAINLGNHEFNFGLDILKKTIIPSKAAVLSANTRSVYTNTPWQYVKPYTVKEFTIDGEKLRIGVIGTITPAIPNFENPKNFYALKFTSQEEAVNRSITALKQLGVHAIIVASHSGVESSGRPYPESGVATIAKSCPGVNLIISGHDHALIDNAHDVVDSNTKQVQYARGIVAGVPVMAPQNWGKYLNEALITFDKVNGKWHVKTVSTSSLSTQGISEDPQIVSMAQKYHNATINYLNTKLGTSTGEFLGADGNKKDTALVDLINKVQMYYGKADISAAASFSQDARIPRGDVTLQHVASLYIYENYMFTIQINGDQLKKYLEKAAECFSQVAPGAPVDPASLNTIGPAYNYDMISGVNYVIDLTKPNGSRIKNLTYNGKAVQPTDTFKLALNNYRFNGGGGYMTAMGFDASRKPVVLWDSQKQLGDNGQVRSLIASYIKEKGTISPEVDNNWKVTSGSY